MSIKIFWILVLLFAFIVSVYRIGGRARLTNRSYYDRFECGFMGSHPFNPSGVYRFIVIGIFYVVLDLEIALLLGLPYQSEMYFNMHILIMFIIVVRVGYLFEVHKGYVRWRK